MVKARVFVSSVMEGFEDRRVAAQMAIERVGADPVMAEDFPTGGGSPRNACLDGVASSDACAIIVGSRGGWTTPSGKLVVEEEYEEAVRRNLLISVYIEETTRDAAATALMTRLSDYVSGHFRASYRTPSELLEVMQKHLSTILQPLKLPMTDMKAVSDRLGEPYEVQYQTTARLVVAPEREEEVVDRVAIGGDDFLDKVFTIGHAAPSKIFDFRASKEHELQDDALVIHESPGSHRQHMPTTRVEITPEGIVTLDKVVSPEDGDDALDMARTFFLVRSDIERTLRAMFAFAGRLFDAIDPYQRHQRFVCGISFAGVGFRTLVDKLQKRESYSMASDVQGALILEKPRVLGRSVLADPSSEIARALTLLGRRITKS